MDPKCDSIICIWRSKCQPSVQRFSGLNFNNSEPPLALPRAAAAERMQYSSPTKARPRQSFASRLFFFGRPAPARWGRVCVAAAGGRRFSNSLASGSSPEVGGKQPLNYNHTFHSHFMLCGFLPH